LNANSVIDSQRGQILDRNGAILANNEAAMNIVVDPGLLNLSDSNLLMVLELLELAPYAVIASLSRQKTNGSRYRYLKRRANLNIAHKIAQLDVRGISLEPTFQRHYPHSLATGPLLGLTNIDNQGIDGIEKAFDDVLANGDLQLTIDASLQQIAFEVMKMELSTRKSLTSSTTLVNTDSGEVLAMVNYPSFDPSDRAYLNIANVKNNAVIEAYQLKGLVTPFVELALKQGLDLTQETNPRLPALSLYETLSYVGIGQKSRLSSMYEPSLSMSHPENWLPDDIANTSMGIGISATPVQILQAYMTLLNEGAFISLKILLNQPMIVKNAHYNHTSILAIKDMLRIEGKHTGYPFYGKAALLNNIDNTKGLSSVFVGFIVTETANLAIITTLDIDSDDSSAQGLAQALSERIINETLQSINE
jgi:cell division protein FtsI (penicillin-binding protein 3)